VHKSLSKPVEQILQELSGSGLPNLWLPARDSFLEVDDIPHLGTGKVDLKGLKTLALERFGANARTPVNS
jgi:acyl-[acyl-carrier-protein]-phospholipid O-acyltransferase / long-chain-fatty-acid--[acyl-carrier-protein] ligase